MLDSDCLTLREANFQNLQLDESGVGAHSFTGEPKGGFGGGRGTSARKCGSGWRSGAAGGGISLTMTRIAVKVQGETITTVAYYLYMIRILLLLYREVLVFR